MDAQAPPGSPIEARCAIHQGEPFTSVCSRCGAYMCKQCTEGGRFETCSECRARTGTGGVTLRRDNWTLEAVMKHAYAAYRHNIGTLTVGVIIMIGVLTLFNGVTSGAQAWLSDPTLILAVSVVMYVPQTLLQGLLTLGLLSMSLSAARGEQVELGQLFGQGERLGGWVVQLLFAYVPLLLLLAIGAVIAALLKFDFDNASLLIALSALVLLSMPALLYFYFGLAFASTELVAQPQVSALTAVGNSWRMARGQRLMLVLCGLIVGALCFAGLIACFVGLLFAIGYAGVLFATLYLTLRNGAEGLEDGAVRSA